MEEQNSQVPPMPPRSNGKRMWHLCGPLVIKWAIGFGVSMAAMMALSFTYIYAHYDAAMSAMQDETQMMNLYANLLEEYINATTLVEGIAALVTIPVMLVLFHKDRVAEKLRGVIPNKKAPIWKYLAEIVLALSLSMGLNNLILIANLSSVSDGYQETMDALYSAPLFVQIISLAVLVPISEELVFRGLLFKRLREQGAFMQAALYSSIVFGLLHMNMVQMIYGFILGMMLAYVYEKYGSVKAPIVAHMAMNLLSVLGTEFKLYEWLVEDSLRIGIITVVCAAVSATMFVLIQRIDERPDIEEQMNKNENLADA